MFYPQLDIVPVIAQVKSFSKAARMLNLSQPAISSKVQAIEDQYGAKIFHRTTHGVTLTEAGKIVCVYAEKFTSMYQAMDAELDNLMHANKPQITIGSSCTSGNYAMPYTIQAFRSKHPHVDIKLDIANTEKCLAKLADKQIDVAIIDGKFNNPNLTFSYLDCLDLVFVTANTNKITRKAVNFRELLSIPLIIREKGAAMRTIFENLLSENGYQIGDCNIVSEMNSIQSLKNAVAGGLGVSLIPLVAVQNELNSGSLQQVKVIDMNLTMDVNLAYRKEDESSLVVDNFIRFLTKKNGFCWNLKSAI